MINHERANLPICERESGMAVYRIQLVNGAKSVKTDLRASNEDSARIVAEKWFDCGRWRVTEIRRMAD